MRFRHLLISILAVSVFSLGAFGQGNSGRITGVAVDPSDPSGNTIYVSSGGGVWSLIQIVATGVLLVPR